VSGSASYEEKLAEVIRAHYELGRVETPFALPAAHQRRHRKMVVQTGEGKFLAKTYRNDPYVLDDLRFQHRLSDFLREHGLPVAHIQPSRTGKRIVELDTWALELQAFVEAEAMKISRETLRTAGDALGRFHTACRDFPRPERDGRMWRFSEVPRESFAGLFEKAQAAGDPKAATEHCNRVALFLHESATEMSFERRKLFETGLIHGDWHGGNLLFREGDLAAIVDLEFAGDGCFLEDLAYALSNLCVRTSTDWQRLAARTDRFLISYEAHRSLSLYEEIALYYAVGIKHVVTVAYQLPQLGGTLSGFNAAQWLERLALQCDWLRERARRVRGL
jgi:Ser/Thr protein kinase RdoA (MazF antagonist)